MDYFENIIKRQFEQDGYWVRQSFRVNLKKHEKVFIGVNPTIKQLYSIDVGFSGPAISKQSGFRARIEALLREKYGKPVSVTDHIVFKTYDWKVNENALVTMRPGGNSVHVIYHDITLARRAETEKFDQVRKGFTKNDKEKF